MFQRVLTKMFLLDDADAIFFETAMNLRRFPHMAIECIPLPISSGETAPIYFKVLRNLFIKLKQQLIMLYMII